MAYPDLWVYPNSANVNVEEEITVGKNIFSVVVIELMPGAPDLLYISISIMKICANCKNKLQPNQITYNITDLGTDIVKVVEETIGREAKVHDSLCSHCFNIVIQAIDEEEEGSIIDTEIQDPLLGPPEIQVKKSASSEEEEELEEEEEPKAFVNYQDKVKKSIDSSEDEEEEKGFGSVVNLQSKTCVVCSEGLDDHQIISLPLGPQRDAVENHIHPKKLSRYSVICNDCLQNDIERKGVTGKLSTNELTNSTQTMESTTIHIPNYYRASATHTRCFVKDCQSDEPSRKVVPKYMRRILLENFNVFLPSSVRSCSAHRREYYRDWNHLRNKNQYWQEFNSRQVEEMLEVLRNDP